MAPDGGERLEGLTEAKRVQSLANVDDEDGGNAMIPINSEGDDSIMHDNDDGAGRKYTDDNLDVASNDQIYLFF